MGSGGFDWKKLALYGLGYIVFLLISFILFLELSGGYSCSYTLILLGYITLIPLAVALFSYYKKMPLMRVLTNTLLASALQLLLLFGFFVFVPLDFSCAEDARLVQSQNYWSQEARPFAIDVHSVYANGNGVFYIKNKGELGTLTLTNFSVGNGYNETSLTFAKGEDRAISVEGISREKLSVGDYYDLPVNITYLTSNDQVEKQYGAKLLRGRYA